jgi:hypothetical protein
LLERELVALSIQGGHDLVEAQEIADQRQMFTVPCKLWLRECTDHDAANFSDVAHVGDASLRIKRQRPTHGTIGVFLRSHSAEQVLVVERRDHERVVGESGFPYHAFDFSLVREMRDIDRAAADRLHVRKRRPDQVPHAAVFRPDSTPVDGY